MKHSVKSAAVFDRWFFRLGGGERMVCSLLSSLHKLGYTVTLLSCVHADLNAAEEMFGIDLSSVQIRILPDVASEELASVTNEYDLFINASHLDYIPNTNPNGNLLVFFPSPLHTSFLEKVKRKVIVPFLSSFFISVHRTMKLGVGDTIIDGTRLTFSKNQLTHLSLTLEFPLFASSVTEQLHFESEGQILHPKSRTDLAHNRITYVFDSLALARDSGITLCLPSSPLCKGIRIQRIWIPSLQFVLWRIFATFVPALEQRLHGGANKEMETAIESYPRILSISQFTSQWIQRYWNKGSQLLYPPVDVGHIKPKKSKRNWIVHIGRFFAGGHSKKQLELVHAFSELNRSGIHDWELHFIGTPAQGAIHEKYFQRVLEEAKGLPIYFHGNASNYELYEMLSNASIYWHATGYGEDLKNNPIASEHFGITTVEAMAAGCVPVVFAAGGQEEIVNDTNGYTWTNIRELVAITKSLVTDNEHRKRLGKAATLASERYATKVFHENVKKLFDVL